MTETRAVAVRLFASVATIATSALATTPVWGQTGATTPPPAAIDSIFARYDHTNTPGCALGVYRDERLVYGRGYGMAELNQGVPIGTGTVFYIASTSKQFTAASIALLAEEGKLALTDPVRKWVPELPAYAQPITIANLVHHSSGIRDYLGLWAMSGRSVADEVPQEMALDLIDACPPATREDVARYVERVAQDELDRRQNMAREAERAATPLEAARNASPEPTRSVASETAPRAEEPTVRLRGVRPWHVLVGTLALVLVAGGGWLALRPHDGTSAIAPAQASPIDSAGPPRAEPVPSPTTGVSATSTESVAPSTTAPVPSTSATSANTARAKPRGTSPSKPGTRAPRALDPEESAAAGDRR